MAAATQAGDDRIAALSLAGEFVLLAIDPAQGGLRPRHRRRFRRALRLADRLGEAGGHRPRPLLTRRIRREAFRQLERARLIGRRRPFEKVRLADRAAVGREWNRLRRCIEDDDLSRPRDQLLLLLLASSRLLAGVLSRDERRLALRRLSKLKALYAAQAAETGALLAPAAMHTGSPEMSGDIRALGRVAYHQERDMVTDAIVDFFDGGGFQLDYGLGLGLGGGDGGVGGGDGGGGGGDGGAGGGGGGGGN